VEVIVTPTELLPEDPDSYYGVARKLAAEIPGAFLPDQYSNPNNPLAHYSTTGPEVWAQTDGAIDVVAAGVGTAGTITGTARHRKEQSADLTIVRVHPEGAIYTAGPDGDIHQYYTEGVGEDFYPETVDLDLIDRWEMVDDHEAFGMARKLARVEGILTGPSGGMAVAGALRVAREDHDALVVVLIPDSGRGYLSKTFNDDWLHQHGFSTDIP